MFEELENWVARWETEAEIRSCRLREVLFMAGPLFQKDVKGLKQDDHIYILAAAWQGLELEWVWKAVWRLPQCPV